LSGFGVVLRLARRESDADLMLELGFPDGGIVVRTPYSRFTPISLTRPWAISPDPRPLEIVSVESMDDVLRVVTRSDLFEITDQFTFQDNLLKVHRQWQCTATQLVDNIALGTAFCVGNGIAQQITLPGVLYNNNPSAAANRLVPHLEGTAEALVVEEHRLPIPGVNVEWRQESQHVSLTMLVQPDVRAVDRDGQPECDSLGVITRGAQVELVSLSGVVAFNGEKDHVYGGQNHSMPALTDGYLSLRPGQCYTKTLYLTLSSCKQEGRGFRSLVTAGWDLLKPQTQPCFALDTTVGLKLNALRGRWRDYSGRRGFIYLPEPGRPGNVYSYPPTILYGWTGQAMKLAWCALKASVSGFDDAPWQEMGTTVLDHFVSAPSLEGHPGCRLGGQSLTDGQWFGVDWGGSSSLMSSRSLGETLTSLADCLTLLHEHRLPIKPQWRQALVEGVQFLSSTPLTDRGIFPAAFSAATADGELSNTPSTAGVTCVMAMLAAAEFLNDAKLTDAACLILDRYAEIYTADFRHPFNGATLDAACEDKEAGLFYFLAAARAYALTQDARYAKQAELAADWVATFIYHWNVPMRPGTTLADEKFCSCLWPGVSVQNMHLDVFHAPYELYAFGRSIGNDRLMQMGQGIMQAWTHGIAQRPGHWGYDIPGEQAEQFFQTNYIQGPGGPELWRGGFNPWNPSWIIANVLEAALKFRDSPAALNMWFYPKVH
jgi:hypothetical protein